jgi:hypothetical protein
MDNKQFETLMKKMDSLEKLLAFNIIKDKTVTEQVDILTKAGLRAKDIAEILNKTENQVYVTQSTLRKRRSTQPAEQPTAEQTPDGGSLGV